MTRENWASRGEKTVWADSAEFPLYTKHAFDCRQLLFEVLWKINDDSTNCKTIKDCITNHFLLVLAVFLETRGCDIAEDLDISSVSQLETIKRERPWPSLIQWERGGSWTSLLSVSPYVTAFNLYVPLSSTNTSPSIRRPETLYSLRFLFFLGGKPDKQVFFFSRLIPDGQTDMGHERLSFNWREASFLSLVEAP